MTDENQVNEVPAVEVEAPRKVKEAKVRTSLTLEPELFEWAQRHAVENKLSVSAVMGEALAAFKSAKALAAGVQNV